MNVKKKFQKANQYIGEKLKITQREINYDDELTELERKFNSITNFYGVFCERIEDLIHPDHSERQRIKLKEGWDKLKKKDGSSEVKYRHAEVQIATSFEKGSFEITGVFGESLNKLSKGFSSLAEIKEQLEEDMKTKVFDKITYQKDTMIKDIITCRKRLRNRRLELEVMKRDKSESAENLKGCTERFDYSNIETYNSYVEFVENYEDQRVKMVLEFADSLHSFFKQCETVSRNMVDDIMKCQEKAMKKAKVPFKSATSTDTSMMVARRSISQHVKKNKDEDSRSGSTSRSGVSISCKNEKILGECPDFSVPDPNSTPKQTEDDLYDELEVREDKDPLNEVAVFPQKKDSLTLKALFNFDGEDDDEITLKAGDIIKDVVDVDENWYEGTSNGKTGLFPKSFAGPI